MNHGELTARRDELNKKLEAHKIAAADEINTLLKLANELQMKIQKRNNELQDAQKLIEGKIAMLNELIGDAKPDDSNPVSEAPSV